MNISKFQKLALLSVSMACACFLSGANLSAAQEAAQTALAASASNPPQSGAFKFDIKSDSMDKSVPNLVVLPSDYATGKKRYPVIYLLHGHGGNFASWHYIKKGLLAQMADVYGVIFVCPDGAKSWYWDSPKNPASKYETYVSKELVSAIDANFRTVPERAARAITGFSMGGHGALWLGFRHPDTFKNFGSTSGGVDIRPFPKNWNMEDSLGSYEENKDIWESHTVTNQTQLLSQYPDGVNIIIDCGYQDFFYKVNEEFHKKLLAGGIQHDYITRKGAHNAEYWNNSLDYQILFFVKNFAKDGVLAR